MGDALSDAARHLPPPGPLTLVGLDPQLEDPHPTELRRTVTLFDQDAGTKIARRRAARAPAPTQAAPSRTGRYAPRAVPIVVAVLVVGVLVAAGVLFARSATGGTVPAPQFVGLSRDEAAARAAEAGLTVQVEERDVDDPAGRVIGQVPPPGSFLNDSGTVRLIVSRGPPPVAIPEVAGKSQDEATLILAGAGFAVDAKRAHDENVRAGVTIRTDPAANESQAPETTITLIVSDGPAPVAVPDVAGRPYDAAAAALQAKRFGVARADDFSETVAAGAVIGTDPSSGQLAPRDSQVVVHVSKGPQPIPVPQVVGVSVEQASQALQANGLVADVQNFAPGRTVKSQSPAPGTPVNRGTNVTLVL
jgi:serine/threonine-protein kinase